MTSLNHLGQPVGDPLPDWAPRPHPPARAVSGRWCTVEPLDPARHAHDLYHANSLDETGRMWTYLGNGPFEDLSAYRSWLDSVASKTDPMFFTIVERDRDAALGVAAFLRIEATAGSIEVGHVAFSPALQHTVAATEAMALMMARVFDELGYRRYEWKCDALNEPSRRAASRLGFVYEGTFRQALVVKGRNRDTAWFSVLDSEWPRLRDAFEQWLSPRNFDIDGRQRVALSALTRHDGERSGR
jgi:RimJ/RimL family protein N-acetyltransferase